MSLASLHAVFEQPVVVFPAAPASPQVLIARLGRLTLRSNSEASGGSSSAVVHLSVARASLSALNVADNERGVPRVRGTSEAVRAMLVLAHYLRLVASPGEHCVLEDISADFMVVKRQTHARPRDEEDSNTIINWPEDFDVNATTAPFDDTEETASRSLETWITVSACLTQPLHVRLSKGVYHQLLQTLDNLSYDADKPRRHSTTTSEMESSVESSTTASDSIVVAPSAPSSAIAAISPGLAMRFRMPRLVVETFTEMGGERNPIGLTRLSLSEFYIAGVTASGGGLAHIEATLAALLLENLLPDYSEENRYLLYSHLPSQSSNQSKPRHPLANSCPSLIESDSWSFPCETSSIPFAVHSRSLQRPFGLPYFHNFKDETIVKRRVIYCFF